MNKQFIEFICKISLVFVIFIFISILLIKRFVYFNPSKHFVSIQENFDIVNNQHLHGWFLQNKNSNKVILLCHGNFGNISHKQRKMIEMRNIGYSVLAFDYSGYGKSKGSPNERNLYDDASMMVSLLLKTYKHEQIILYGESLGGPVATYVARKYCIPTLILEGPLPSVKILIKNKYPILSFIAFLFPEFDTETYLKDYKGKSLIMHSTEDKKIPYSSVQKLIDLCSQHIQIKGLHNDPVIPWEKVKIFIES
jgi:fermentation-respiration switch protein FrsA (DUF1100 family)